MAQNNNLSEINTGITKLFSVSLSCYAWVQHKDVEYHISFSAVVLAEQGHCSESWQQWSSSSNTEMHFLCLVCLIVLTFLSPFCLPSFGQGGEHLVIVGISLHYVTAPLQFTNQYLYLLISILYLCFVCESRE